MLSPVQINTDEGKTLTGVLIEASELKDIIGLIDFSNANGLKGNDACLVMQLKDAYATLEKSNEKKD